LQVAFQHLSSQDATSAHRGRRTRDWYHRSALSTALLFCQVFLCFVCISTLPAITHAQAVPEADHNLDLGQPPNQTFDHAQENVNIASGNLNIVLPLVQLPGRDGKDLDVTLTYNSKMWTPTATLGNSVGGFGQGNPDLAQVGWTSSGSGNANIAAGWQLNVPYLYAEGVTSFSGTPGPASNYSYTQCWTNYALVMGDGTQYSFPLAQSDCYQTSIQQAGYEGTTTTTLPFPYTDKLLDCDNDAAASCGADGSEGVLLDLTHSLSAGSNNYAVVKFPDGSQILFNMSNSFNGQGASGTNSAMASAITDANGNTISIGQNAAGYIFTDTLGRTVNYNLNAEGSEVDTVTYHNDNGKLQTIVINHTIASTQLPDATFSSPAPSSDIATSGTGVLGPPPLSYIQLPDGLTYRFQYNQYGELLQISYPVGGYTRYSYQAFPVNYYEWTAAVQGYADDREVTAKYQCRAVVSPPGATTPSGYIGQSVSSSCPVAEDETTYSRSSNNSSTMVKDPLGNVTTYSFWYSLSSAPTASSGGLLNAGINGSPCEESRSIYQGAAAGTPLKTILTTPSNSTCGHPSSIVTTIPGNHVSEMDYAYNNTAKGESQSIAINGSPYTQNLGVTTLTPQYEKDYDYGSGTKSALLSEKDYSWITVNPVNGADYESPNIYNLNLPLAETIKNGSGTVQAQTAYEYDNYVGGIAASGAVQHGTALNAYSTSYTTRGNRTATILAVVANSGTLTTRNYKFDDAGNVLQQQDPLNHLTTFSYADVWGNEICSLANSTNPAFTNGDTAAYMTSVTNALGQTSQIRYNSCTGSVASTQDANLNQTLYGYDLMGRLISTSYPDNGYACLQYSDAPTGSCGSSPPSALPLTVFSKAAITNSVTTDKTTVFDGLGRTVQSELTSAPEVIAHTDTTYDGLGRIASVSNPYFSSADPTFGVTSYTRDALGRITISSEPGNVNRQWCYDGVKTTGQTNCAANAGYHKSDTWTDYYDENGSLHQQINDALRREVAVMEPGPASEAVTLETDYQYDPLNNLTQVDQWGGAYGGSGDHQRTFTYDGLSRLLTATNPETGTVTYSYTNASGQMCSGVPSDVCSKTDARGIVTSYEYDALGRLLAKRYTGDQAATASSCYQYDTTAVAAAGANLIGRLTNEWTQSASAGACPTSLPSSGVLTRSSILAYDAMGRVSNEQQCTLTNCSSGTPYAITHDYDLAGNPTMYTNGIGSITLTNSYNAADHLNEVTSSWVDPTHPSPLFSNPTYDAPGELNTATYGAGLTTTRTYNNRLRITGETDAGAIAAQATPGTATVTITGAEQTH
jgi:YD repeat-containing protein